jgi:hypothetical protein
MFRFARLRYRQIRISAIQLLVLVQQRARRQTVRQQQHGLGERITIGVRIAQILRHILIDRLILQVVENGWKCSKG